nr:disintegrin and metalloproteinase domain-containing protein 10-like [Rhipicephalus microplus]
MIAGDPSSGVFGALHSGVFEGSIRSRQGNFYMERSRKLFGGRAEPSFHSLMYSEEDVRMPAMCGLVDDVRTWMDMRAPEHSAAEQRSDRATMRRLLSSTGELSNTTRAQGGRERRGCNLEVNVDHLLHAHFLDDARGDGARARERITAMVAQHVARASDVFRAADFGGVEDISFTVQRIGINDSLSCATDKTSDEKNPFCAPAADIGYLLHLTSLSNHDEFCLSYTWTYRDFFGGVLGLAWVANAERNYGGVCEKARPSAVSVGGSTEVLRLSTNVGVLTFVNHNSFVATAVSEMVFCHELGHSFGADGKKPNNDKFSQCSRNSIGRVLAPMVAGESARENCLQAHSGPICGNGVVERGEQCDCGSQDADCSDQCCHSRHNVDGAAGCTLRAGANCSPSAGQCCDESCGFKNVSTMCGEETECREEAVCEKQFLGSTVAQ